MSCISIESASFTDLNPKGALFINKTNINVKVFDSTFSQCFNDEYSGGAISILNPNSTQIKRCCGESCYTKSSGNALDFGQFIFIRSDSSDSNTVIEMTTVSKCPSHNISVKHNGPFGFYGSASFSASNSNSSNNYCRLGPGLSGFKTTDKLVIKYLNFANESTYHNKIDDENGDSYTVFWIATAFYQGTGRVSKSNYIDCSALMKGTKKPPGEYKSCCFLRCKNYALDTLDSESKVGNTADFDYPITCAKRIYQICSHRNHFNLHHKILKSFFLFFIRTNQ